MMAGVSVQGVLVEGGGEQDGGDAGPGEGVLVAGLVHHLPEVAAAVEGQVEVHLVAGPGADVGEVAAVRLGEGILSDGEQILPVAARRDEVGAEHIHIDHRGDLAMRDVEVPDEAAASEHIEFLAVESDEDEILPRPLAVGFHRRKHPRQREERGHAGGIVVGAGIDGVAEFAQMVIMSADDDVFVAGDGGGEVAHDIAHDNRIAVAETLGIVPVPGLEPEVAELRNEVMLSQFLARRAGGASVGHLVGQILHIPPEILHGDLVFVGEGALCPRRYHSRRDESENQQDGDCKEFGTTFPHFVSKDLQK